MHYFKCLRLLVFLSIPGLQGANAQLPKATPTIYTLGNVAKLNSTDFLTEEGKKQIVKAIGETRVVLLGEQTHFDGDTFAAKVNMVRFLHEELGFDVIAFESDMYALEVLNRELQGGGDIFSLINNNIYPIWTDVKELRPLYSYINDMRKSKPLYLSGFDCRHSLQNSRQSMVKEITVYLKQKSYRVETEKFTRFCSILSGLIEKEYLYATTEEDQSFFFAELMEIKAFVSRSGISAESSFFKNLFQSIEGLAKNSWSAEFANGAPPRFLDKYGNKYGNVRDFYMAQNALWIINERFRDHKVILWGASYHFARNLSLTDSLKTVYNYRNTVTMADLLTSAGQKYYSIGFTAYKGSWKPPMVPQPIVIEPAKEGTLENMAVTAGLNYAFIDLKYPGEFSMRPLGHMEMIAKWSSILDGVVFFSETHPATGLR